MLGESLCEDPEIWRSKETCFTASCLAARDCGDKLVRFLGKLGRT